MKHLAVSGLFLVVFGCLVGCKDESNQDVDLVDTSVAPDASAPVDEGICLPITDAQPVPARPEAYVGAEPVMTKTVYVDDMFNLFASHCGGCHVDVGLGRCQVEGGMGICQTTRGTFSKAVNRSWVDSIDYDSPTLVMPPPSVGGLLPKDRRSDDPIYELKALMQAWLDAGRPRDVYQMPIASSETSSPYALDPDLAKSLTNIGSCLPDKTIFATEKSKMDEMDLKFANMMTVAPGKGTRQQQVGLPLKLSETDLFTFDSRELAKLGVISYAPAYPQWVDPDSRSMRHVRVPRGQSITFDSAAQMFTIPGDTRFYRTIMQRVIDKGGVEHWRKMETQLILSWPNLTTATGWSALQSLYGTYAWNENETEATLVTDPFRDGTPFRDRIVTYVSDAGKAEATLATNPKNKAIALRLAHAARSYAISGSKRCAQCHVGSPSKSFVLGFQPLQIARRPVGEGGVIDAAGSDELSQLDRLISYGVITGIGAASDVVPLESSQGTRTPRNDHELVAQGYLLGNCAHCHNPGGDPSLENPSIMTLLDFQPSSSGGIFQFPLESYSPRITRGGGVPVPYITPSLLEIDHPDSDPAKGNPFWKPKCDPNTLLCDYAPWRSLIYRGVDTPFTYSDDVALFPRMPMNTQSFDVRAPRIIGDWMVSIPSVLKDPNVVEYAVRTNNSKSRTYDGSPQPYKELKLGKTGYKSAATTAAERLDRYHSNPSVPVDNWVYPTNENPKPAQPPMPSRYQYEIDDYDIFDPLPLLDPEEYPVPVDALEGIRQNGKAVLPPDNVPDHAHWVVLDRSIIPGDWAPRRSDWASVLVSGSGTTLTGNERLVVDVLQSATMSSDIKRFAMHELPIGLWKVKSDCDFSVVPTVSSYSKDAPTWIREAVNNNKLSGTEPVYSIVPGELIHNLICSNCHGVQADSRGREATILSEMTGGRANVTDLANGIMKPAGRSGVFQSAPLESASADDWAARYFAWMGLGGTKIVIPASILAVVGEAGVAGTLRPRAKPPIDANMLSSAQDLCTDVLPAGLISGATAIQPKKGAFSFESGMFAADTSLIYSNGDAALWGQLCSVDNPAPVRALKPTRWDNPQGFDGSFYLTTDGFYDASLYPTGASVLNQRGEVVTLSATISGIPSDIYFPMCIRKPSDPDILKLADTWLAANLQPTLGHAGVSCNTSPSSCAQVPYCPTKDKNDKRYIGENSDDTLPAQFTKEQLKRWTIRGALNAGFVAFQYLNELANGDVGPTPAYDQCSQLSQ